jgi:hypothetical protein
MKPAAATRSRNPAIACPHCEARLVIRSSEQVTPTYRGLRVLCDNDDCGWSGCADLTITRTIRPSACPNPRIHLPMSAHLKAAANDDMPMPANDAAPRHLG